MSSLPTELDFSKNPAATPERMNTAMDYIAAKFRALEAIQPEFLTVIDELKGVGLERVTDALLPIFEEARQIADTLEAIKVQWETDSTIEQVTQDVAEAVTEEFADYRHRYLGAKATAPTVRDDGSAVGVGDMYFDTVADQMRVLGASGWKNAGSSVAGVMSQINPIVATAGQTVFTISGGYEPGYLIVTLNGAVLPPSDYTATNSTTVTLGTAVSAGDELAGIRFGSVTLATVYDKAAADAKFRTIADSYTKSQVDTALAGKAASSASYTKSEADNRHANRDLSNLSDANAARTNLGVGTAGTRTDSYFVRANGIGRLSVGTSAPSSPSAGDLWVDTN